MPYAAKPWHRSWLVEILKVAFRDGFGCRKLHQWQHYSIMCPSC